MKRHSTFQGSKLSATKGIAFHFSEAHGELCITSVALSIIHNTSLWVITPMNDAMAALPIDSPCSQAGQTAGLQNASAPASTQRTFHYRRTLLMATGRHGSPSPLIFFSILRPCSPIRDLIASSSTYRMQQYRCYTAQHEPEPGGA